LLYLEELKMVYFSVAMAVYFWMAIYRYERSIRSRSSPIGIAQTSVTVTTRCFA
jgi:hypothetical protein